MPNIITLNAKEFMNLRDLSGGIEVKLIIVARVIDRQESVSHDMIVFDVRTAEARSTSTKGRFDRLLESSRRVLREQQQVPKVKPLGHTGQL